MSRVTLFAFALLTCCRAPEPPWARAHAAHPGEPTVTGAPLPVTRTPAAPVIDGRLDEPVWATAAELGPLVRPGDGGPARAGDPVSGFARMTWDDTHLFVGAVVHDRRPSSPFKRDDTDPHIWSRSSAIELMIQPGDPGDNRDYFEIQIDVAGAVFDTRWDDYNHPITGSGDARVFGHQEWTAHVQRAVHTVKGRLYAIEAALPWSAFAPARVPLPPRAGDVWRVNVYSFRDGQREALAWSPIRGQGNFHRSSRFGRIVLTQ